MHVLMVTGIGDRVVPLSYQNKYSYKLPGKNVVGLKFRSRESGHALVKQLSKQDFIFCYVTRLLKFMLLLKVQVRILLMQAYSYVCIYNRYVDTV